MNTSLSIGGLVEYYFDRGWVWFSTLSREEWLIVLAVTCAVGFLLVKSNFGIRNQC